MNPFKPFQGNYQLTFHKKIEFRERLQNPWYVHLKRDYTFLQALELGR